MKAAMERTARSIPAPKRVPVSDFGFAALPAEKDRLSGLFAVEVDEPALEVLDLDALFLELRDLLLESAAERLPLFVEARAKVAVRVVLGFELPAPEGREPLELVVDFVESDGPRLELGEQLSELMRSGVRLLDGPEARRLRGLARRIALGHRAFDGERNIYGF
jgi:hypothetical protein